MPLALFPAVPSPLTPHMQRSSAELMEEVPLQTPPLPPTWAGRGRRRLAQPGDTPRLATKAAAGSTPGSRATFPQGLGMDLCHPDAAELSSGEAEELQRIRWHREQLLEDIQPPGLGSSQRQFLFRGTTEPTGWPRAWPQAPCSRPASGQELHTDATCHLQGIQYLIEHKLLTPDVQDIAQFLYKGEGLSKTAIGTYLGERDPTNLQVLQAFVDCHEFANLNLVQALRQFLWSFRLPGEAQKIDRMMEAFAARYCLCNPGVFQSTDTCYVLSFSIIMLNTGLHNPSVRDRPPFERFVSMNRGINDGSDLPEEQLRVRVRATAGSRAARGACPEMMAWGLPGTGHAWRGRAAVDPPGPVWGGPLQPAHPQASQVRPLGDAGDGIHTFQEGRPADQAAACNPRASPWDSASSAGTQGGTHKARPWGGGDTGGQEGRRTDLPCRGPLAGGRVKTWKRRWFILTDNCLYYFEFTTDKEPRGIIPLENLSVEKVEDPKKPFCLELYNPSCRGQKIKACKTDGEGKVVEGRHGSYRISASSAEERDQWIEAIRASITRVPFYDLVSARKKKIASRK
uniref:cytohesin-4 n=1 Tax=Ictidomys tridecemlineatus TaxID=43179 RepID=UPI001A9DB407|nr:cytohesin-4 [Ictidomys tridecemlineatus]